jgi:hypothetical protein
MVFKISKWKRVLEYDKNEYFLSIFMNDCSTDKKPFNVSLVVQSSRIRCRVISQTGATFRVNLLPPYSSQNNKLQAISAIPNS